MNTISVAKDFTEFPGLRHCSISEHSGEDFYHDRLNAAFTQAFKQQLPLTVELDFVDGYASSFLDEAFGNLVYDFGDEQVRKLLHIVSNQEPHWIQMIEKQTIPQWAERRRSGNAPKVTRLHPAWNRLVENELKQAVWQQP